MRGLFCVYVCNSRVLAQSKKLLPQLHKRRALAAFVLRSFFDSRDVGMRLEEFADAAAQNSGAVAVNDPHARQPGEKGVIEVFFEFARRLIDRTADKIDLRT